MGYNMQKYIAEQRSAMMMNTRVLSEIGLTQGEIKVYIALLKLGQSSTGPIAKEAQVSRAKLYMILDKLAKKGLVGHCLKGKVQHFKAMEPKQILQYMDERNQQFNEQRAIVEKMLPAMERTRSRGRSVNEATLYEGFKAIKNFYAAMLDELSAGDTYYVIGASYGTERPGVRAFFQNHHLRRAERKIKVKMLANHDVKGSLVESTYAHAEIRFLPQYLISNMIIVVYKEKSFIFFLSEEPVGFLMENEEVTRGFKAYFDAFWKTARKS
jgi:sugar-specific transcriptional regulator TrmB